MMKIIRIWKMRGRYRRIPLLVLSEEVLFLSGWGCVAPDG